MNSSALCEPRKGPIAIGKRQACTRQRWAHTNETDRQPNRMPFDDEQRSLIRQIDCFNFWHGFVAAPLGRLCLSIALNCARARVPAASLQCYISRYNRRLYVHITCVCVTGRFFPALLAHSLSNVSSVWLMQCTFMLCLCLLPFLTRLHVTKSGREIAFCTQLRGQ